MRLDDAAAFLREAEPLLLADEARHNLLFGIAGTARDAPDRYPERAFWLVRERGETEAAALRTPPWNLVLARPRSEEALAALADGLSGEDLPGVTGALPEAETFARLWADRRGSVPRRLTAQGIHALEEVVPPPRPPGRARTATAGDRRLAIRWFVDFAVEASHAGRPGGPEEAERIVDHRLSSAPGGILLWEDGGEVVSLAGWGGPTPNGIRIGPVYTPPARRCRGYATALTAALSQRLLGVGYRFCFLYTDLANATANGIYARIGYRRVCESAEIAFDRGRSGTGS